MFSNQSVGQAAGQSIFGTIANSKPTEGGIYMAVGNYLLSVDALKLITSRKGLLYFVAEFDILESNNPDRPVGTKQSWLCNLTNDVGPSNVKQCIAAIAGIKEEEVSEAGVEAAVSAANPAHNRLVKAYAYNKPTLKGADFTRVQWTAVPEEIQKQGAALRTKAGI